MVLASSDTLTFHSTSDVSIIYKLIEMCGFSKTLILTIFGVICRASTECGCKSFGGLCIQDKEGRELTASCNYTSFIGDTFYQSDGYTLVDGCKPESCGVGKCVPTFGGFYCECPPGFYGSFCNFSDPELDSEFEFKRKNYHLKTMRISCHTEKSFWKQSLDQQPHALLPYSPPQPNPLRLHSTQPHFIRLHSIEPPPSFHTTSSPTTKGTSIPTLTSP